MGKVIDFSAMRRACPGGLIARNKIEELTGGILTARYCANLDSAGKGIPNRVRIGRKIAYPIDDTIKFLEERTSSAEDPELRLLIGKKIAG